MNKIDSVAQCGCSCHFGGLCKGCQCPKSYIEKKQFDPVNRPAHYNQGKAQCKSCGHPIECIDITRHMDFAIGNAMKYLWRFREKNGLQDLMKARWYLDDAIKQLEIGHVEVK